MCEHDYFPINKETLCFSCGDYYYNDLNQGPLQILDRKVTADLVTAKQQTAITLATQFLEQQGRRYLVDFGWETAEAYAAYLGYRPPHTKRRHLE